MVLSGQCDQQGIGALTDAPLVPSFAGVSRDPLECVEFRLSEAEAPEHALQGPSLLLRTFTIHPRDLLPNGAHLLHARRANCREALMDRQ